MRHLIRSVVPTLALSLALMLAAVGLAQAQATGAGEAPAGFVAPADPQPDETNAQRSRSQPGNNAPFWRAVRDSGVQAGVSTVPTAEAGVLIQPFVQYPGSRVTTAGEAWRQVRNQWIIPYGGALVLIAIVALALFYLKVGPLGGKIPDSGRKVERFSPFERAAHGVNALAFVVLAVSGVIMAFGQYFLLPILGATVFGWLAYAMKNLHNFAGPLFALSLLIVILTFARDNLPRPGDWNWLKTFGGMLGKQEVPSHRFNAGEKVVFWCGVFGLGIVVVVSGLAMDMLLPGLAYTRGQMQIAHMVHGVATALMLALFLGHIYMGTIGTRGALDGMRSGMVDESWVQEHHEQWYDDYKAGRLSSQISKAGGSRTGVAGVPT